MEPYLNLYRRPGQNQSRFFEEIIESFQGLRKKGLIKTESIPTGDTPLCVYELKGQGALLLSVSEKENPAFASHGQIRLLGASPFLKGLVNQLLEKKGVLENKK